MNASREPKGPREAPTGSESGERREVETASVAAVTTSVAAPCLRAVREDVFVLPDEGERTAAVRLLTTLPTISEEEEDRLD